MALIFTECVVPCHFGLTSPSLFHRLQASAPFFLPLPPADVIEVGLSGTFKSLEPGRLTSQNSAGEIWNTRET